MVAISLDGDMKTVRGGVVIRFSMVFEILIKGYNIFIRSQYTFKFYKTSPYDSNSVFECSIIGKVVYLYYFYTIHTSNYHFYVKISVILDY